MDSVNKTDRDAVTTVFKKLPWHTNVLARLEDPHSVPKEMELYNTALRLGTEKQSGPDREELRLFFQGPLPELPAAPLFEPPFTKNNKIKTAEIAIAYRLLDVYTANKTPPPPQNLSFEKRFFPDLSQLNYRSIHNWGELVVKAATFFDEAVSLPAPQDDLPPTSATRTYRHFTTLCRTHAAQRSVRAKGNFETAALHLSYLLEGAVDFPDSSEDFVSIMQTRAPSDSAPIGKPFRNYNMQQLRAPLHTALTVSPLCLLVNTNLNRASLGRHSLCQIWHGLGSFRPESVKWAESLLWGILWDYTLGKIDLLPSIRRTLRIIITRVSEPVPITELTWFQPLPSNNGIPVKLQHEIRGLVLTPPPSKRTHSSSESDLSESELSEETTTPAPSTADHQVNTINGDHVQVESSGEKMTVDESTKPIKKAQKSQNKRKKPSLTKKPKIESKPRPPPTPAQVKLVPAKTSPFYMDVIDLSQENELITPPLSNVIAHQKIKGHKSYLLYGPDNKTATPYTPHFHSREEIDWFDKIISDIESFYIETKPRFISDPPTSVFHKITEDRFQQLSESDVQERLRTQHIIVTNRSGPSYSFGEDALETLTGLEQPITIHDLSLPQTHSNICLRRGTLLDLGASAGSSLGKSLLALDIPMYCAPPPPTSFASDIKSWTASRSPRGHEFPVRSTKWGQAGTVGSYHKWRLQRDGFATYIDVRAGSQYFVVSRPKTLDGSEDLFLSEFSDARGYTGNSALSCEPSGKMWELEAILLRPGHLLIMRPNTPHVMVNLSHSVSHGGRFYATSTIRESCYGILHTFLFSPDTSHTFDSRLILRRMLVYYRSVLTSNNPSLRARNSAHVPCLDTFQGVLDLLTLCNIIEMGNVLTPKLYTDKDMCNRERHELIEGRKVSRAMVDWIFDHFQLSLNGLVVLKPRRTLYWPYLAHQAKTLLWYKQLMEQRDASGVQNSCTYTAVRQAIQNCFHAVVPFWEAWHECSDTHSFAWPGPQYDIIPKQPTTYPREHDGKTLDDQVWLGEAQESDLQGSDYEDSTDDEQIKKKARHG